MLFDSDIEKVKGKIKESFDNQQMKIQKLKDTVNLRLKSEFNQSHETKCLIAAQKPWLDIANNIKTNNAQV